MSHTGGNKGRKVTIYDIAGEVGTSPSTVSRVLSNSGYPVREELRSRIVDAADRLGYTPNVIGRMLKKNDSRDIGVIVPNISNPFYPQLVLGVEQEARKLGYDILLCNSFRDPDTERKYLESLYQKQVRGIILSSINQELRFLRKLYENGIRIVVLDQENTGLRCSRVGFDYIKGGMMAIDYLAKKGHSDIAFVTSPLTKKSRMLTFEGFKLGLYSNGIPYREDYVLVSETEEEYENSTYEFENGKRLAGKLLSCKNIPTAVFAVNDMTAFGVIHGLLNSGVKVPEDVSVVGFDNIEISSMINPPLTTVAQPSFETGRMACRLLVDSMEDSDYKDVSVTLEPALVVRSSVAEIDC